MLSRAAILLLAAYGLMAGCAAGPRTTPAEPAPTLRAVTYNIFAGRDLERRSNLERIASLLDSVRADVVFLQEVDRLTSRSGGVDQSAELARHAGFIPVFGRSIDFDGGEYGNAILSRWPVLESRVVALEVTVPRELAERPYEPRSLLHAVVATPSGPVHLVNTHLDHRAESVFRPAQMLRLLAYIAEEIPRGAPVILAGDLNAWPNATEVRALGLAFQDAWLACGEGPGFTFRSDSPDRRIDYVMLMNARCVTADVLDTRLSDHRPVVVDVRREPRP